MKLEIRRTARHFWRRIRRWRNFGPSRRIVSELVVSTAERISGTQRSEFVPRTSVLKEGRQASVRLHEMIAVRGPRAGRPLLRLVEKSAAEAAEYRFYELAARSPGAEIAPELYAACDAGFAKRGFRYVVVVEHLPRRGLPDFSEATASRLAEAIAAVARLPMHRKGELRRASQISDRLLRRFATFAAGDKASSGSSVRRQIDALQERWGEVRARADRELPCIPAHNDIHLQNVCPVSAARAPAGFVFLDWEAFALNYAGADLHHFVRLEIVEPSSAAFVDALRRRYAERLRESHGIDPHVPGLGAQIYALRRAMRRAVLQKDRAEIPIALEIYHRIMRLLVLAAPAWLGGGSLPAGAVLG